jgi:hypothetical protein
MNSNKNNKLKKLHKTIDTIVKARQIQKARVDSNVMKEELTQEELKKFHKPMVDQLASIVDTTTSTKTTLLPIEDSLSSPIPIAGPSTTLIPIEHTLKESSKSPKKSKESSKQSTESPKVILQEILKDLETALKNVFYPDEGIDEGIVKNYYGLKMPSEILKDKSLYDSNHDRVVQILKSLGGQKRSKYTDP